MKLKHLLLASLVIIHPLRADDDEPELGLQPEVNTEIQQMPLQPVKSNNQTWKTASVVLATIAMVTVGLVVASSNEGHHAH